MTNERIIFNISCWFVIVFTLNLVHIRHSKMRMQTLSPSPYFFSSWYWIPIVFCIRFEVIVYIVHCLPSNGQRLFHEQTRLKTTCRDYSVLLYLSDTRDQYKNGKKDNGWQWLQSSVTIELTENITSIILTSGYNNQTDF